MNLAIAVEKRKHPKHQNDYKVWYLDVDSHGNVVGIGVKTKDELIQNLFENYRQAGKSNWKAFTKDSEKSTPIEAFHFISRNIYENTHFGNLPTLNEFQQTLNELQMNLELNSIAS